MEFEWTFSIASGLKIYASYYYISPNDTAPNRSAYNQELDILLRNRKDTKPDYSDITKEIKELFAEVHLDICEPLYEKIKTIFNSKSHEKMKIFMLISVLMSSAKFKYLVLPNIKDSNLLAALNYGISKITKRPPVHIDWKRIRFYSNRSGGIIRLDAPEERTSIFSDSDDDVSLAEDEDVQFNRRELQQVRSPRAEAEPSLSEDSFEPSSLETSIFGQGLAGESIRQFLPTKEIWQKLNLYILENKNIGNDSKYAYRDYTELLDILLKRKQINKKQYKDLLRKFDR